jgi:hypothetical protein
LIGGGGGDPVCWLRVEVGWKEGEFLESGADRIVLFYADGIRGWLPNNAPKPGQKGEEG